MFVNSRTDALDSIPSIFFSELWQKTIVTQSIRQQEVLEYIGLWAKRSRIIRGLMILIKFGLLL